MTIRHLLGRGAAGVAIFGLVTTSASAAAGQGAAESDVGTSPAIIASLIGAMVLGIVAFLTVGRLEARFVGAFALLAAMSAGFGLFAALSPTGNEYIGLAVFVSLFVFFRLLSRFESLGG